jgi:YegS/Rv2252/BmrU family lipid kinase
MRPSGISPDNRCGGDGTINEVVNGIARGASTDDWPAFGVIPLGSVNDFVDNLGLPKDLNQAARVIAAGATRKIDLGMVNDRYFTNNAAIGLEPYVTLIQQRIQRLKGNFRYLVATLIGVRDNPSWTMHLEWEGGDYQGLVSLVTVGNSPRTGGIFFMTPHADPFDGKLTFVFGYLQNRRQILKVLPSTTKPGVGSYVEHPAIHEINTTWLSVESEQPTPAHADGEIFSTAITRLKYRLIPARLPVLLPSVQV